MSEASETKKALTLAPSGAPVALTLDRHLLIDMRDRLARAAQDARLARDAAFALYESAGDRALRAYEALEHFQAACRPALEAAPISRRESAQESAS